MNNLLKLIRYRKGSGKFIPTFFVNLISNLEFQFFFFAIQTLFSHFYFKNFFWRSQESLSNKRRNDILDIFKVST